MPQPSDTSRPPGFIHPSTIRRPFIPGKQIPVTLPAPTDQSAQLPATLRPPGRLSPATLAQAFIPGESPTLTGTAAVTLDPFTSVATGTETFTGTSAPTLAGATSVATGTAVLDATGTAAVTLNPFTLAATGTGGDSSTGSGGRIAPPPPLPEPKQRPVKKRRPVSPVLIVATGVYCLEPFTCNAFGSVDLAPLIDEEDLILLLI